MHEALPKPITVPAIRGQVVNARGESIEGASIGSYTPRHWIRLTDGELARVSSPSVIKSGRDGKFGIPKRGEPYRVVVTHPTGVASCTHETLLNSNGKIALTPWVQIAGTFKVDGKPQVGKRLRLYIDTLPWSYSRGGPRLTTEYQTVTDAKGEFLFEQVPPLPGRIQHLAPRGSIGRTVRYECKPGQKLVVDMTAGAEVIGKLRAPNENATDWSKTTIRLRHVLAEIPYPKNLTDQAQRRKWSDEWQATLEGQRFHDERMILANMHHPGLVKKDGSFRLIGIPPGQYQIILKRDKTYINSERTVRVAAGEKVNDLGVIDASLPELEDVKEDKQPKTKEKKSADDDGANPSKETATKQLPKVLVRVVNDEGKPVRKASVLLYDRNNFRGGQKMDFKPISGSTNQDGLVRLGRLPQEFFCIKVNHKNYDSTYRVLYGNKGKFFQTNPVSPYVKHKQSKELLTVEFVIRTGVDLNFKVVDSKTGEDIFFPQIYFQDEEKKWWTIALIDAGGQHDFLRVPPEIGQRPMLVAAHGYAHQEFQFGKTLPLDKPVIHRLALKPIPDLMIRILTPAGNPAAHASVEIVHPEGLGELHSKRFTADEQGILIRKFPEFGKRDLIKISHASGTAELRPDPDAKAKTVEVKGKSTEVVQVTMRLAEAK